MARATKRGLAGILMGAGLLAMAGTAGAADLDFAPPPAEIGYDWSGFYIGAGVGYIDSKMKNRSELEIYDTELESSTFQTDHLAFNPNGALYGGYAGYNWHMASTGFVLGVDADIYGTSASRGGTVGLYSYPYDGGTMAGDVRAKQKIDSTWAVRGRAGWAIESFMAYVAGGYAGASVKTTMSDTNSDGFGKVSNSTTYSGWTMGGGVDFLVTPYWVIGIDYQYKDLGRKNTHFAAVLPKDDVFDYEVDLNVRTRLTTNQFTLRGSYKF
ncbi:MAG: outer membrane protein [Hyphomicrobiales bacterium]